MRGWRRSRAGSARMRAYFGCPLFGGDTVRTPGPITISIAAFGAVPHGKMVRRAGARPGDRVVVTGTIGDAALGLLLRRDRAAVERWRLARRPAGQPRGPLSRAGAAQRASPQLLGATPRRPWTSPTDLPAISPSSAAPPGVDCRDRDCAGAALRRGARGARQGARADRDDPHRRRRLRSPGVRAGGQGRRRFASRRRRRALRVTEIGKSSWREGARPAFWMRSGKPLALARPSFSHF